MQVHQDARFGSFPQLEGTVTEDLEVVGDVVKSIPHFVRVKEFVHRGYFNMKAPFKKAQQEGILLTHPVLAPMGIVSYLLDRVIYDYKEDKCVGSASSDGDVVANFGYERVENADHDIS